MADDDAWDLHLHSRYSWDTAPAHDLVAVCEAAIRAGLRGIAITDHFDSEPGAGVCNRRPSGDFDLTAMVRDVAAARESRPELTILSGLEYGEPHLNTRQAEAVRRDHAPDIVLGAVHAIVHDGDLLPVEDVFPHEGIDSTLERYLDHVLLMVEEAPIDVLAHLEYPLRYLPAGSHRPEQHADRYRHIISAAAIRGISIEYNTKSAARMLDRLWPVIDDVRDVTFTIGSDAHSADLVGHRVHDAARMLAGHGFGICRCSPGRLCRHLSCRPT
ncbi:PHP domain-containing protein [Spirillospora sp. CA-255316]